jgi:hypothetical protein
MKPMLGAAAVAALLLREGLDPCAQNIDPEVNFTSSL